MNIAISKQKLTFILTDYRDVLRVSLFAEYDWANIQWGSSTTR